MRAEAVRGLRDARQVGVPLAVVIAVFSVQLLFSPTVEPGLLSLMGSPSDVLTGLVLGLAFFSDALRADE